MAYEAIDGRNAVWELLDLVGVPEGPVSASGEEAQLMHCGPRTGETGTMPHTQC
jgi:hypothetical protein